MKTILSALRRSLAPNPPPHPADALYAAIVAEARQPEWYLAGEVPDTLDGRFDMLALVLALATLRLEAEAPAICARLTERFITDMDGTLRQDGVGDQNVGKHIGRMVAAFGGRLGAYRDAGDDDAALAEALRRNLWRGADVSGDAVDWVVTATRALAARLAATPATTLIDGTIAA